MIWYASLLTIRTDSGHFNYTSFVAGKCSLTQLCVDSRHKRRTNRRRMDKQIAIRNGPLNGGRLNGETPSFPPSWYESSLRHINYGVRIVRTPSRRPFASPLYRGPLWIAICLSVALSVRPSISRLSLTREQKVTECHWRRRSSYVICGPVSVSKRQRREPKRIVIAKFH